MADHHRGRGRRRHIDAEHCADEIYLARIDILPGYQGRGIGTQLISTLIDQARQLGQDLVLDVLTVNRRARALYQRLGLIETARHGDGDIKIIMRSTHQSRL